MTWLTGENLSMRLDRSLGKKVLTDLCNTRIYFAQEDHKLPHWVRRDYWLSLPNDELLALLRSLEDNSVVILLNRMRINP